MNPLEVDLFTNSFRLGTTFRKIIPADPYQRKVYGIICRLHIQFF